MASLRVTRVEVVGDTRLSITMSDGRSGILDMQPFMRTDFFRELAAPAYFAKVQIFFDGIAWPNGQDLGPDSISAELQPHTLPVASS